MKNNRRLYTMLAMLCALLVLFIGYKTAVSMNEAKERKAAEEAAAKDAENVIADYSFKKATAISYTKKGAETISLVFQNNRWMCETDATFPIKQTTAAYMANALASMKASSIVQSETHDMDAYGLTDPAWRFTISYSDDTGEHTHTYLYGDYNDFSDAYYFMEEGKEKVYLVVAGLTDFFEYSLHDLADAGTFPVISKDKFDSVDLTFGGETIHLAGEDITEAFVQLLNVLQPSSFVTHHVNAETKAEYGLTSPWMTVKVNYKEMVTVTDTNGEASDSKVEQMRSFTLHLGDALEGEDGEDGMTPYLVDGYTFVYTMPQSVVSSLEGYLAQ